MSAPEDRPIILVVEDDDPIRRFLRSTLAARGYAVVEAATVAAARLAVTERPPAVVLLDLGLPDGEGVELVREIRTWSQLPIVVLSARGQESSKVEALDCGADDYLTKPFGVPELLARLRVAMRHHARGEDEAVAAVVLQAPGGHSCRIDLANRRCSRAGPAVPARDIALTPTEFRLLAALVRHRGKLQTHAQLLREVWGPNHTSDVAYLRVYMGQLRQKLEPDPAQPQWFLTETGVGYRLEVGS